ncbi:MAG: hypothetical protein F6K10_15755 [Moorea sp. SIO2B7]|nr:hypothetical protein [Moorena sp. SIO2B7]
MTSTEQLLGLLYTHVQSCVEVESPSTFIARFRDLFIEGAQYPDPKVWQALHTIVKSDFAQREFKFILNRCCYIIINRWQKRHLKGFIPKLIEQFEIKPMKIPPARTTLRLRELVQRFTQSDQYRALRHLGQVIDQDTQAQKNLQAQPLRILIPRYPYLYEHCILTNDCTNEQRQTVRSIKVQQQQQFDKNLSRYIIYGKLQKNSRSVKNPTLLSDRRLDLAVNHFQGKVDGYNTYRDLAEQFRTYSHWTPCYRTFKKELYEYLTYSIDLKSFNDKLYKQLQHILEHNDAQKLNEVLLLKTSKKLLDFLVVQSIEQPNHYNFVNLTANLGTTPTIGLLLKIVLLCRNVKQDLEKRFSILFNHYQDHLNSQVKWLVESLENLNIAFSIYFGSRNSLIL